jgi:hypothetical protein
MTKFTRRRAFYGLPCLFVGAPADFMLFPVIFRGFRNLAKGSREFCGASQQFFLFPARFLVSTERKQGFSLAIYHFSRSEWSLSGKNAVPGEKSVLRQVQDGPRQLQI